MFEALTPMQQVAYLTVIRCSVGKRTFRADRVFTTPAQRKARVEFLRGVARNERESAAFEAERARRERATLRALKTLNGGAR